MDPQFLIRLLYGEDPSTSQWTTAMRQEILDQIALDYTDRGSTTEKIADFVLSQYTKASHLYKWAKDEPKGAPEKVRSEMYGHMALYKLLYEEISRMIFKNWGSQKLRVGKKAECNNVRREPGGGVGHVKVLIALGVECEASQLLDQ